MHRVPHALPVLAAVALAVACAPRARGAASESGEPNTIDVIVAATTDIHARARGWDYYENRPDSLRGLARVATVVDSLRRLAPGRVLLVDAGDIIQGNPLAYVAARVDTGAANPVIAAMNTMGYDAAAVGNHDFNYGLATLERADRQADFPLLAANAVTPDGHRPFPPIRFARRGGAMVALIGATTPGSNLWDRDNLRGRLTIGPIVPAVRAAVDSARHVGADLVIVLLHSGLDEASSYDSTANGGLSENVAARVAREVPGIDLIVYGHTHRQMADTIIGGALLLQPKNWATSVGVAHITLVRDGTAWRVTKKRSTLVPVAHWPERRSVLAATQAAHDAAVAWVRTPIGSTDTAWRADSARVEDTPLIDFILAVEQQATGAQLASTAAFSLRAHLDSGAITRAEVAQLYPYDNTLEMVRITGRQLREYLEFSARYFGTYGTAEPAVRPDVPGYNFDIVSGVDYTIDLTRPAGARLTRLEYQGRPVADADTFTLAINNYRLSGGGAYAMLRDAPVISAAQVEIRDLLIDEVRRRGRIEPGDYFTPNWRIEPPAAIAAAYDAMHALPGEGDLGPTHPARAGGHRRGGPQRGAAPRSAARAPDTARAVAAPRAVTADATTAPPGVVRLRVLSTNDFHGALEPRADSAGVRWGGAAQLATTIADERTACRDRCWSILVDAGDLFQGTAASNLAFGRPVLELYRALGYDAAAVGNHEFDWGTDTLHARMTEASFRMLGANIQYRNGRDVPWIPGDTLIRRGPLAVGLIGVIGDETYRSILARRVSALRFADPAPIIDSLARALRARGADVVLVLDHSGAFCAAGGRTGCAGEVISLADRLTGPVDAIIAGHTHTLVDTREHGMPVVQARSNGRALAILDLAVDTAAHRVTVTDQRVRDIRTDSIRPDSAVAALVERATAPVRARLSTTVARLAAPMQRSGDQYALGNLIADAQRWATHADVAITNNGGIRTGLSAGPVTLEELFAVQPFDNELDALSVTGAQLRRWAERLAGRRSLDVHVSGLTLRVDRSRPEGQRVTSLLVSGRRVRADRMYRVVVNEFMATGGDRLGLGSAAKVRPTGVRDLDALARYLASRPQPVQPPADVRIDFTSALEAQ